MRFLKFLKLISRKIWATVTSWNFHIVDKLKDSFPRINLCWFNSLCSLCLVGGLFGGRLDGQWPSCRHCEGGLALRPFWTIPLLKSVKKETLLELARRREKREGLLAVRQRVGRIFNQIYRYWNWIIDEKTTKTSDLTTIYGWKWRSRVVLVAEFLQNKNW